MKRRAIALFGLPGLLLSAAAAPAATGWAALKPGVTADEAVRRLGEPLIRTSARGVELFIYDGRGEIIFVDGPALGWTVPSPTRESVARPARQDVLIRPVRRAAKAQYLPPIQYYREVSATRFRYR